MKLLKILVVIFAVYFIRRFIQMYRVMKAIQEQQLKQSSVRQTPEEISVINAEYKVID